MAFSLPTTGFDFNSSLSPSEAVDAAKGFLPKGASAPSIAEAAQNLGVTVEQAFSPEGLQAGESIAQSLGLDTSQFLGGLGGTSPAWTFITAPEDISWSTANQANRIDIFGTNNPPVVSGSRGMRDLTLGNALVEGFVRNKQVEDKVLALENLLNYGENISDGFVAVPVYQVWANDKAYGDNGYFIIKDVRVKETMRDLTGKSTRAYVDISLMQVPAYQVNSGRDQASATTAGAKSGLLDAVKEQANQNVTKPGTPAAATPPGAKPAAGAGSATPASPPSAPPKPPVSGGLPSQQVTFPQR